MLLRTLLLSWLLAAVAVAAEPGQANGSTGEGGPESEEQPPPAANDHVFTPGELRIYHYETHQQVEQQNLDDELTFESTLRWRFALRCQTVDEQGATLVATVFLVQASHQGPGSNHTIDSSDPQDDAEDPVLGHLLRMNGTSLTIRWQAGRVQAVEGSEALIDALAGDGFDAERRRRVAAQAYGPTALRAFWQAVLLQPAAGPEVVDLSPPLSGEAERRWQAGAWELHGQGPVSVELATSPAPLRATLADLSGEGRVTIDERGLLQQSTGELRYRCDWLALGQPASQQHRLRWQLVLVDYKPAP